MVLLWLVEWSLCRSLTPRGSFLSQIIDVLCVLCNRSDCGNGKGEGIDGCRTCLFENISRVVCRMTQRDADSRSLSVHEASLFCGIWLNRRVRHRQFVLASPERKTSEISRS